MRSSLKIMIWIGIMLAVSALLIAFETAENKQQLCKNIVISIDNQVENYFVEEEDILEMITLRGKEPIIGTSFTELNLRQLEHRLKDEPFLSSAEVYNNHAGQLLVKVVLRKPMARVVRYNGPDAYISEDGRVLPVSGKYTKRTILITGAKAKPLAEQLTIKTGEFAPLYKLINFIRSDKFWAAQIAQIKLLENGEIILFPQVTKQVIEFGYPDDIEMKFKKLKLFYEDILPRKGWNHYARVSLKYKNQIICE